MAVRKRRLREVAEREQLFLTAARDLIRQDGLLNLQMARIAEKCDYAVGTLYQHFASKEDLLVALAADNVHHRVELFRRAGEWKAGTRDRIMGIAVADLMFVRLYPEHFRLTQLAFTEVVWGAASAERRQMALEASEPLGQICDGIIEEAMRCGDLRIKGLRPQEVGLGPWALTMGTHSIVHVEGVFKHGGMREAYQLMMRHLHCLLNGLDWHPLLDPGDDAAVDSKTRQICNEVFNDIAC
ncbi:MAG: helix-turn-helix domain containing protein [Nevskia sp.]|nr:helix-turn-helix domain containing protein [Nevskia sp.]